MRKCADETQGDESPALIATLKAFAEKADRELADAKELIERLQRELDGYRHADEINAELAQLEDWYGEHWEAADEALANYRTSHSDEGHVHE